MNSIAPMTLRARFSLARFTQGLPDPACVTLNRQRIYILPTRAGLGFVAMLALMLLGAINYQLSIGYACTFLLGSLAIVSILHAYRNLAGLEITAGRADPVFAGSAAHFPLRLRGGPRGHQDLRVSLRDGDRSEISLAAQALVNVIVTRATTHRGELPMGRLTVATTWPLGLFRAWSHLNLPCTCLVYPHPGPERPLPQPCDYRQTSSGDKGKGADDFAGLRPYRSGDSLRQVYWKGVARSRTWLTKQFGGDRSDELWLDYAGLPGLAVEARLSQLCRWVLQATQSQQRFGLRLPGRLVPIDSGSAHYHACLSALARFEVGARHD